MSSVLAVSPEDVVWHFFDSRKLQRGPVSGVDLLWFFAAGHVTAETYCWRAGLADWAPWAQVSDLVSWQGDMEGLQKPWFYMDSQMCKQGPVEQDILKDMKRAGLLNEHSRVWKKGDIGTSQSISLSLSLYQAVLIDTEPLALTPCLTFLICL